MKNLIICFQLSLDVQQSITTPCILFGKWELLDYCVAVSFVPDLGFNLFPFHVVQEKHEIIMNKTGAHLLNGRLVFPRRSNGSSLRATRVMPGGHASASNALATFADPSSPVQYRSVTSPVAHETSRESSSCRTSNAGDGMGGKSYIVAWK